MYLSKSVAGSTLSFSGNVTNLESHSFAGFMLVFVTENQLVDPAYPETTWNFVFRGLGLNKTLNLGGLSASDFAGTWNVPSETNKANIQVTAALYDDDAKDPTYGWQYAVQSVCDICGHSVAASGFLPADVNKDGKVNILDITIVAKAFGSRPGDLNWNEKADLDKNGQISILDITRVAKDFGKAT